MRKIMPFHLAFPVSDLARARTFYGEILSCPEGRASDSWIDFNLFGHQIVAHLISEQVSPNGGEIAQDTRPSARTHNSVDGHDVPVPHFGVVLPWDDFHALAERVRKAGIPFVIEPYIRFQGQVGEQMTMFFYDFSGNALEFKSFRNLDQLFTRS